MSDENDLQNTENTTRLDDDQKDDKYPHIPEYARATDIGNAMRIVHFLTGLAFFHHALKVWFLWQGTHWAKDIKGEITLLAVRALNRIIEHEPALIKWLSKSLDKSKIMAAIRLAADLLPLPGDLDRHVYKLNVKNGTIDLQTGELMPPNPGDYITKIANVEYHRDAACPKWLGFLFWAFSGFEAGIHYFQKAIGYALTGDVSEKRFFILWGPHGNNGKTLIINVLRGILGSDYCVQVAAESLTINRIKQIRSDIARLDGYRFASTSETGDQYKFNEPLIKVLTGGDVITARKLYENDKEFTPELKLFVATNPKPIFNLADAAMMNRVDIIPFMQSVKPEEMNRTLTAELIAEEGAGILAWAVQGAVMWAKEGLGPNPFDQDSASIIKPIATINKFVAACCDEGPGLMERTRDLHRAFVLYKEEIGDDSPEPAVEEFGKLMSNNGYLATHRRDSNYRESLALKADWKSKVSTDGGEGINASSSTLKI